VRVGVDTSNDGKPDTWSNWEEVKETYEHTEGFAKQIKRNPAAIDLKDLPAGFGFCFELQVEDTTANDSRPILDQVTVIFRESADL